jgi:hypothetical protein
VLVVIDFLGIGRIKFFGEFGSFSIGKWVFFSCILRIVLRIGVLFTRSTDLELIGIYDVVFFHCLLVIQKVIG